MASQPVTRFLLVLLALVLVAGCAPKPTPTPVLLATAAVSDTPAPTSTAEPTFTATATTEPTATNTPEPTSTPVPPLAVVPEQSAFWCIPIDYVYPASNSPVTNMAPAGARVGTMKDGTLNLQVPAISCTLVFAFNQPVPAGVKYEMAYEVNPNDVWMSVDLAPVADNPNLAYVNLVNEFVINHSYWEISYPAALKGPDGAELWKAPARFFKALPNPCWDGSLPDPVTLYCKSTDGDWNYEDFPNFNPDADVFK